MDTFTTDIAIVGAGPTGTALALELARAGVSSTLIERSAAPSAHPKMDFLNANSMEFYAALGLESEIRAQGVPADRPFRFLWRRTLDDPPVGDWLYDSVDQQRSAIRSSVDGTMPARPYQRVLGSDLEAISRRACRDNPLIDIRESTELLDLNVDAGVTGGTDGGGTDEGGTGGGGTGGGVELVIRDSSGVERIHARYVVGCDGARSRVREAAEITVDDIERPMMHTDAYIETSDPRLTAYGSTFLTILGTGLTAVSRDGDRRWTLTYPHLNDDDHDRDPIEVIRNRVGSPLQIDAVLNTANWEGRLSVASSYRRGNVLLVGDAAHSFFPTGGHGANTGLGDAANLGWKLAAVVSGSADDRLLDSYEAERRPVALFAREMCANLLNVWRRFPSLIAAGASDAVLSDYLERESYQVGNLGIHFAADYWDSPIVGNGSTSRSTNRGWSWCAVDPTLTAGARLPHVALEDGRSNHDLLGTGWTAIGPHSETLANGLARHDVDVACEQWDSGAWLAFAGEASLLIRPDRVVAGVATTADDAHLIAATALGHQPAPLATSSAEAES